jgi:hypothetical protein
VGVGLLAAAAGFATLAAPVGVPLRHADAGATALTAATRPLRLVPATSPTPSPAALVGLAFVASWTATLGGAHCLAWAFARR